MICSHGDWGLSPTGALASTLENFQVVFQVRPKFCFGPTCPPAGASGFSFQAHLPASRAGSTINSSLQLQPNKSWFRISVNCGRAAPRPSLADLGVTPRLGRQSVPAWTPLARSVLQPSWAFKVCLLLSQHEKASGKLKLIMSKPVTSWPEPGERRVTRRTSNTSQKVPCNASVDFTVYIPCINERYYHEMNTHSIVV